jgi:nitroimidazol reductase NimA-like FMN-containing flavoprotein (pyridoxamine 5'-phosphate oxidase superfamily)
MRRQDREITNFDEITDILRRADTLHLGMNGNPFPYVVPLSFGYEAENGVITIYLHGAAEGFKHDLIRRDNNVCVEVSIFHRFARVGDDVTTEYESVIGFGHAKVVTGGEAVRVMDLMLAQCGFEGFLYDKAALNVTRIYKITLADFTGKRRLVK